MSARERSDRLRERVRVVSRPSAQAAAQPPDLKTQPPRMIPDRRDDAIRPGKSLVVGETENGPAKGFQLHLSQVIFQNHVGTLVNAAIDLEDQPEAVTGEVGEIFSDGMLATEAVTVDLARTKAVPQVPLRQAGDLTLIAPKGCTRIGHNPVYGAGPDGSKSGGLRRRPHPTHTLSPCRSLRSLRLKPSPNGRGIVTRPPSTPPPPPPRSAVAAGCAARPVPARNTDTGARPTARGVPARR